jgi:hypothetical protein
VLTVVLGVNQVVILSQLKMCCLSHQTPPHFTDLSRLTNRKITSIQDLELERSFLLKRCT